jgi:protein-tyrosine-phosphatase
MKEGNILFVCKFNQTRSQMARAIFEKINTNKKIKADSAGVISAKREKELANDIDSVFRNHGLNRKRPKQLSKDLLNKQKLIVIVADDVPLLLFNSQEKMGIKLIQMKIKDGWKHKEKTRKERLERVYQEVEKKIKSLIKSLD